MYLAPGYPMLFAAGGVCVGASRDDAAPSRAAALAVLAWRGAATVPLAIPLLPVDRYVRYSAALGRRAEHRREEGRSAGCRSSSPIVRDGIGSSTSIEAVWRCSFPTSTAQRAARVHRQLRRSGRDRAARPRSRGLRRRQRA